MENSSSTIWKFKLDFNAIEQEVMIPENSRIIHVGIDPQQELCIWVMCDANEGYSPVKIFNYGTGWFFDSAGKEFLGTVVLNGLVHHIFKGVNS